MIRHVVLFKWAPETSQEAKDHVGAGLAELPAKIDVLRAYRFGPDAGLADGNWDYSVTADFDDAAGYEVYRDHPAHTGLIAERIAQHVVARGAAQFEFDA